MDVAVVVNLRSRQGSEAAARRCAVELPNARVIASSTLEEAHEIARALVESPPDLLLSAGGDGTAVTLLNAMRPAQSPTLGILPLGTGNGWANATGAPRWRSALRRVDRATRRRRLPVRRFDLVQVCGIVAPFAGTGWDAELIDDFNAQKDGLGIWPHKWRHGMGGYLHGLFTRTIPRNVAQKAPVEVELVNTGEDALAIDEHGEAVPLPGGEHGKVLYRGPASVCAAGTSPEWGFHFRAFPFAGLVPRRFNMRVYGAGALEATMRMRSLWRGDHPIPKMHSWMLTRARATFSRPVAFQIGGDRLGHKDVIDYALASDQVDVLDWRRL